MTAATAVLEQIQAEAASQEHELEARVQSLARAKRDAKADTRMWKVAHVDPTDAQPGRLVLNAPDGTVVGIGEIAHDQLADRTGIDRKYYRRMLQTQPALLAENVRVWFGAEPDVRLWRMMAPTNEADAAGFVAEGINLRLRGVLGATYRPIDDAELVASLLPVAREHGAFLKEFSLDERRLYAKFITKERAVADIRAAVAERYGVEASTLTRSSIQVDGKTVAWVNEFVRAGFQMRNSEIGFAGLDVGSFVDILKCFNGMIVPAQVKQRHVGKRSKLDDVAEAEWVSAETQTLDNAALMSRLQDAAKAALDDRQVVKLGNTIGAAKADVVKLAVPLFEWVENAGTTLGLAEGATERLKETTLAAVQEERVETGVAGVTRFALSQGLTALAKELDADSKVELERTGWAWLETPASDLVRLGAAASIPKRKN